MIYDTIYTLFLSLTCQFFYHLYITSNKIHFSHSIGVSCLVLKWLVRIFAELRPKTWLPSSLYSSGNNGILLVTSTVCSLLRRRTTSLVEAVAAAINSSACACCLCDFSSQPNKVFIFLIVCFISWWVPMTKLSTLPPIAVLL